MLVELKVPRYGTNMEEATLVVWRKRPGDSFDKGEVLCELETEKVTATYEAPVGGRLLEIMVAEGDDIAVGEVLCRIDTVAPGPTG